MSIVGYKSQRPLRKSLVLLIEDNLQKQGVRSRLLKKKVSPAKRLHDSLTVLSLNSGGLRSSVLSQSSKTVYGVFGAGGSTKKRLFSNEKLQHILVDEGFQYKKKKSSKKLRRNN